MPEFQDFCEGQSRGFNDGGMIELIDQDVIVTGGDCRDYPQVDLKAGAEYKGCIFFYILCEFPFKFNVYIECSVEKPGTGASASVLFYGDS